MIYSPSNKGSKTEKHGGTFERAKKLEPMHHGRSQIDIASRTNYAKVYTVEHYVKVFFIGQVDQRDMERLQSGDTGWMRSDTGEDIPIIMEDQSCPSFDCQGNKFQFPCRYTVPSRMIPSVALPSGLLMSSSFLWLNQRMELYEHSATLGNVRDPLQLRYAFQLTIADYKSSETRDPQKYSRSHVGHPIWNSLRLLSRRDSRANWSYHRHREPSRYFGKAVRFPACSGTRRTHRFGDGGVQLGRDRSCLPSNYHQLLNSVQFRGWTQTSWTCAPGESYFEWGLR